MMATQTKMIIITSDEDLIRQFSSTKSNNTHIIDLEDDQLDQSIDTNNQTLVNMALLAELSKLNSHEDQMFKRALDSPQQNSNKPSKIPRKSVDMICGICGDRAIGFNYDVLSCASCKSFFRRNAHQDMKKLRCLTGRSKCPVGYEIRRKCQKCRLEKCFEIGMRKDFLQTDEEKQRRQQRLDENRSSTLQRISTSSSSNLQSSPPNLDHIDQLLLNMNEDELILDEISNPLFEHLTIEEWIIIENLRSSFVSLFTIDLFQQPTGEISDQTSALISWSYIASQSALRFIEFFRQIDQFEQLNNNDRFILIKYNIFPLYPILKCFHFNPLNNCCVNGNNEEVVKHQQFYKLCFGTLGMSDAFGNLIRSLIHLTEQDPIILSLLLTVLMFDEGLSMEIDQPLSNDPLAIYRAQSFYTDLLWKYMKKKWNEDETNQKFVRLIPIIFQVQTTSKCFRDYFRTQITTTDAINKLAPLMQSLLQIS